MECFSSVFWGRIGEKKFWLHLFIMRGWFWLEHNTKRCLKNLFSSPRLEHRTIIAPLVQLHGQVAARREGTPPPCPVCLPASATPASPLWPFVVPSLAPRSKLQWSQRLLLRAVSGKHALWQRWGAVRKGGRISELQIIFIPSSTSPEMESIVCKPGHLQNSKRSDGQTELPWSLTGEIQNLAIFGQFRSTWLDWWLHPCTSACLSDFTRKLVTFRKAATASKEIRVQGLKGHETAPKNFPFCVPFCCLRGSKRRLKHLPGLPFLLPDGYPRQSK